jgi:hypothetical protein
MRISNQLASTNELIDWLIDWSWPRDYQGTWLRPVRFTPQIANILALFKWSPIAISNLPIENTVRHAHKWKNKMAAPRPELRLMHIDANENAIVWYPTRKRLFCHLRSSNGLKCMHSHCHCCLVSPSLPQHTALIGCIIYVTYSGCFFTRALCSLFLLSFSLSFSLPLYPFADRKPRRRFVIPRGVIYLVAYSMTFTTQYASSHAVCRIRCISGCPVALLTGKTCRHWSNASHVTCWDGVLVDLYRDGVVMKPSASGGCSDCEKGEIGRHILLV